MYTDINFKTKKALIEAFKAGQHLTTYQPGPFPGATSGTVVIEGPQFPQPHRFYVSVVIENSVIVKINK